MKIITKYIFLLSFFLSSSLIISSCEPNEDEEIAVPKPRAYLRIDLPKSTYQLFDSAFPYQFEYSKLATIEIDREKNAEPYWINIQYPSLGATIYLSYKRINKNLKSYKNDAFGFANKHTAKADDIEESNIYDPSVPIFGKIYDIKGVNVACPYQFWLSDSTSKFIRGALYFNNKPNNDSLAPVIQFVKKDILHLINTFDWNKNIK
jgi:gliding motility-associated lipoprotein GldD